MSTTFRSLVLTAALASGALLGRPADGQAQAAATPPDVLAALLVEVRGLRAAMEQIASAGPRVQLALGRLQLQEQRVNTLVRRLEEVRSRLAQAQRESERTTQRTSALERMSREASDPDVRRQSDFELKELKTEMTRAALDIQRLQTDEATLTQDISAEQGRWSEINQGLEELERSLGRSR